MQIDSLDWQNHLRVETKEVLHVDRVPRSLTEVMQSLTLVSNPVSKKYL